MKQYDSFIFDSFLFDSENKKIFLRYTLDGEIRFEETLLLPDLPLAISEDDPKLNAALFMLHLLGGVSYYKTCLPTKFEVRSGELTKAQKKFFDEVYEKGLGEFFFRNNVDFKGLINFPIDSDAESETPTAGTASLHSATLVPIGGGKDSLVTVELLKKAGVPVTLLRLGNHPIIEKQAHIADLPLMTIERHLSPKLFELNEDGAFNGHVPITAYLSCVSVVAALLYGYDNVILSNERSADYGNVEYLGSKINHQWSKSLEFEKALQERIYADISPDLHYFSLLRPLSELGISSLFAKEPKYFPIATSCNANWRILREKPKETWCGTCPKCAFAFAILSPFMSETDLISMVRKNLFNEEHLLSTFRELLGLEGFKPFECVGTPEETKAALWLAKEKGEFKDSLVMKMFEKEILPSMKDGKKMVDEAFKPTTEHVIPKAFEEIL